jgi:hypothetical protein
MTDATAQGPHGNLLYSSAGRVLAAARPSNSTPRLELGVLGREYLDGSIATKADYLDAVGRDYVLVARRLHSQSKYADRVYGLGREEGGRLWLQYWLFYYFNSKSILRAGLHEGDWEMFQLGLDSKDQPDLVTLAQHGSGERCQWEDLEKVPTGAGDVPLVYIALGSHATYTGPGRHRAPIKPDHCDAGGPLRRPALEVISDEEPAWASWPGLWGSSRASWKGESDSPPGPCRHDQWLHPTAFHNKAKERRAMRGPELETLPMEPRLRVRRRKDRALIGYSFPAGAPKPTAVVLSLDCLDDELPAASYSYDVPRSGRSRIVHPLPIDGRRYEVRARSFDQDGLGSDVVKAPVPRRSEPQPRRRHARSV